MKIGESGKGFIGAVNISSSIVQTFGNIEIGKMGNGMVGLVDEHSLEGFNGIELEQGAKHSAMTENKHALSSQELAVTRQQQKPQGNEGRAIPVRATSKGLARVTEESRVQYLDEV